ncbi:MAG: 5-formyltetrahydrofolate cyclo-ligase [Holophagales bacterium]|nr:5-formyltetrahydrofolate cyclo-ligase [Holophagales bacterium]
MAEKARLRQSSAQRLRQLDSADARDAARRLEQGVCALPEVRTAEGLLVCLSFGAEIGTRSLVDRLLADGKRIWVPRTVRRGRRLEAVAYPCPLVRTSFGLEQPPRHLPSLPASELDRHLDVALVLGLAFDFQGMRLGYGGGYFDRFLAGRALFKIGLAFDLQIVEALPIEPHDVPMDAVVTEARALRPRRNPKLRKTPTTRRPASRG